MFCFNFSVLKVVRSFGAPLIIFLAVFWLTNIALPLQSAETLLGRFLPWGLHELLANMLFRWGAAPAALMLFIIARRVHGVSHEALFLRPYQSRWSLQKQIGVGVAMGIVTGIPALIGMSLFTEHQLNFTFYGWSVFGNVFSDFYKEIMYRSYMLGVLLDRTKDVVSSILIAAIFCALGHYMASSAELPGIFLIILVWNTVTVYSRSLVPVYIAHLIMDVVLMQLRGILI